MRRSGDQWARVGDRHWRGSARLAASCAALFGAMALLVDWDAGSLSPLRAVLWLGLAAALFAVLLPPRVTAGAGRLAVRGPWGRRVVHTDALTTVWRRNGVSAHLVLRDIHGHRVELDPRVLTANPLIWHELDTGVRRSVVRGTLRQGTEVLERLRHHIDDETARAVMRVSGLC
ncbi:hypothetical protein [Streptomyces griseorubiginosus]|uniref:hypothetical protein n=1 Tax=Streptomyces griseorubiginosus TaxID=67304 RepID=UPI002E81583F|nr:hypothetical protein [Streptomyces griseorubiginosus]WUB42552.1 hypothetical protein OHN19_04065 [Streptomyces griseorubiginosus]WUB51070.1 hypothetical protein OG942_04060 [Streptomyces griseorubiginosus]